MENYSRSSITKMLNDFQNNGDVGNIIGKLQEVGYQINTTQKDFLAQYTGFRFTFQAPRDANYTETVSIDPLAAAESILNYVVEEYEDYTHKKMLVVGVIDEEEMTIFVADDGTIYGCNGDLLIDFGPNFETFLYNVMNGVEMKLEVLD